MSILPLLILLSFAIEVIYSNLTQQISLESSKKIILQKKNADIAKEYINYIQDSNTSVNNIIPWSQTSKKFYNWKKIFNTDFLCPEKLGCTNFNDSESINVIGDIDIEELNLKSLKNVYSSAKITIKNLNTYNPLSLYSFGKIEILNLTSQFPVDIYSASAVKIKNINVTKNKLKIFQNVSKNDIADHLNLSYSDRIIYGINKF